MNNSFSIVNIVQDAGYKSIEWNSTDDAGKLVVSGVYLIKFEFSDVRSTLWVSFCIGNSSQVETHFAAPTDAA
ncbi:MAG: hypothetical protein QME25_06790 [Bacteroidota bacterium]|nr:hypothetical protein [Bacteroidota bacterium]